MPSDLSSIATAEHLDFEWEQLTLAGTLHLPIGAHRGSGRPPAVVLLQGSGPADRDSGGFFPPIRQAFLKRGLATFAFDKPGCGTSTGDWRRYGLEARAGQAEAALSLVRAHGAVDGQQVGVFGHSQGGWLAQMLAARQPDLAFAVANSGPSIGVAQQNRYGWEHTLRRQGVPDSEIVEAVAFVDAVQIAAAGGEGYESVERRLLRASREKPWSGYLTIENAEDWAEVRLWATEPYDPIDSLRQIRCPFLAVFGALDPLLPAWRSARDAGDALAVAGNRDESSRALEDRSEASGAPAEPCAKRRCTPAHPAVLQFTTVNTLGNAVVS